MQLFFNTPLNISYGLLRYTKWDYIRAGLLRNLDITQKFYHSRIYSVKSNHFLARLINTINISHNLELERFYDIVDQKSGIISNAMRITSSFQKGALFNGIFYGAGCPEILITDLESFNPFEVHKNWKTVSAVKVIKHPRSDLSLMLPNGKNTGSETGLAVISINIPMLAVQYRAFVQDQIKMNSSQNIGFQTVGHFIHRFVLPNMLPSHLDLAIFNRVNNLLNAAPMGESTRAHSFVLVDYSTLVTEVQEELIKNIKGKNLEYKAIMATIPAIVNNNMIDVLVLPDNPSTRQITWAEVASRIDELLTIIQLGDTESIGKNMIVLNSFVREFRLYERDKSISTHLPKDIYHDILYKMNTIAKLINKNIDI